MTEYILTEECFVCCDSHESEYITLKCCNKHNIHKICLFNIFLNYIQYLTDLTIKNSTISCPLCRQDISIKDYFALDECITLFMEYELPYRQKFMTRFNLIITYNYMDNNVVVNVDETISTTSVAPKSNYTKYMIILFVVMLIVMIILWVGFIYS